MSMNATVDKTSHIVAFDGFDRRMPPLSKSARLRVKSGASLCATMNFVRHRLQRTFLPTISSGTDDVAEHWGHDASTDMFAISRTT
jgi:hypothetical protein